MCWRYHINLIDPNVLCKCREVNTVNDSPALRYSLLSELIKRLQSLLKILALINYSNTFCYFI
jgi:hypothetical protein